MGLFEIKYECNTIIEVAKVGKVGIRNRKLNVAFVSLVVHRVSEMRKGRFYGSLDDKEQKKLTAPFRGSQPS